MKVRKSVTVIIVDCVNMLTPAMSVESLKINQTQVKLFHVKYCVFCVCVL